jgi:hypothetical protein
MTAETPPRPAACAGSGQLTLYGGDRRESYCPVCHQTVATLPHPAGWPVLAEHRPRDWQGLTLELFA